LETTNLSVNEISAKVGYGNIRTFNRVFKDLEGVSPKKYY
jgi:YesN/AraC family two-component response regulator